jgi:hypothetical protein
MLKLCKKDLLAARWFLSLALVIIILYPLQPFWPSVMLLTLGGLFGFFSLFIVFFLEDRNKTEVLYLSLPVKRSAIVGARYFLAGLLTLVGGGAVFGLIVPLSAVVHSRLPQSDLRPLLSIEGAAGFLVISVFLLALYLPFYHRFGFGRGTFLFSIVGGGILGGLVGLIRFRQAFESAGPPADPTISKDPSAWILGIIESIRTSMGTPLFLLAVVGFVIGATTISLRLSLRFYDRREF